MEPIVQLTARGAVAGRDAGAAVRLAAEFGERGCVKLPGLIERSLLARIHRDIEQARFVHRAHGLVATELCMESNTCLGLLHFLVNESLLFAAVGAITGVPAIGAFGGRVYRRLPGTDHHDSWHSDVRHDRRVGMSVNLSPVPYEGGEFEIRVEDARELRGRQVNVGLGDAILFDIADGLEHRVTDLRGAAAKTAFAGWFSTTRDYLAALRADPFLADQQ